MLRIFFVFVVNTEDLRITLVNLFLFSSKSTLSFNNSVYLGNIYLGKGNTIFVALMHNCSSFQFE